MTAVWLVATASVLGAQTAEVVDIDVRQGVAMYEAVDFKTAGKLLERALSNADLARADRVVALAYLGRTHAVLGRPKRAEKYFVRLLQLDEKYRISEDESPRILTAFQSARSTHEEVAIQPVPLDTGSAGTPDETTKETGGLGSVAADAGAGRRSGPSSPQPDPLRVAAVEPSPTNPGRLVAQPTDTNWLPWIIAGGVVLLGGIATAVLWTSGEEAPAVDVRWQLP